MTLWAPVSMGREAQVTQAGDYRFVAGWRNDPFFFDAGAFNNFQFVGQDFFADKDIAGIAGDGETNAGDALAVMGPLQLVVARLNLACIVARHEREAGGEVGDAARGPIRVQWPPGLERPAPSIPLYDTRDVRQEGRSGIPGKGWDTPPSSPTAAASCRQGGRARGPSPKTASRGGASPHARGAPQPEDSRAASTL